MARTLQDGFEMPLANGLTSDNKYCNGRLPGSQAFSMKRKAGASSALTNYNQFKTSIKTFYYRMYVRVRDYPAGRLCIFGSHNTIEGSSACWCSINSLGLLEVYSFGAGTITRIGTGTQTLALDTWYRLSGTITYRGPSGSSGSNLFTVRIDGVSDISASDSSQATGLNQPTAIGQSFGIGTSIGNPQQDGGCIEIDDLVCDDASEPGAGAITLLRVTGQGTSNGWTAANDFRAVVKRPPNGPTVSPINTYAQRTTNAAGSGTTFTLETLASKGISGVTIKSTHAFAWVTTARSAGYRYIKNGVTSNLSGNGATTNNWLTAFAQAEGGLGQVGEFRSTTSYPLSETDTFEAGIYEIAGGAGTASLTGFYFCVDWEGLDPPNTEPDADGEIKILIGSYTGNGTQQTVSFGDPTFKPTQLMVIGDGLGILQRVFWTKGCGFDGDSGGSLCSQDMCDHGLQGVITNGFYAVGGANTINTSGVTYRWIAIRDNLQRFSNTGARSINPGGDASFDNIDIRLDDAILFPQVLTPQTIRFDAMFLFGKLWTGTSQVGFQHYRDRTFVGDLAAPTSTDAAAQTDAIQSMGVGVFQAGTRDTGSTSRTTQWFGFTDDIGVFNEQVLVEVGSYTGNGVASRTIPFQTLNCDNPAALFVFPEDAGQRMYRFFGDGAGVNSRELVGGNVRNDGITALTTIASFDIGVRLNANGVKYHYLAFGQGADPLPPETPLEIIPPPSSIELCEDCGCRMAYVPREIRFEKIPRQIRSEQIPIDPRTEVVLLDRRDLTVFPENREIDIDCS